MDARDSNVHFNCTLCRRYFRDSVALAQHNASTQHLIRAGKFKYEPTSSLAEVVATVRELMNQ